MSATTRDGHFSVAAHELAADVRNASANPASWDEVLDWGERNGYRGGVGSLKDLTAINRLRVAARVPPFSIIQDRQEPKMAAAQTPFKMGAAAPKPLTLSEQLRSILFEEIADLRNGKSTPQRAQAVAKLAHQIIATLNVDEKSPKALPPVIDGGT